MELLWGLSFFFRWVSFWEVFLRTDKILKVSGIGDKWNRLLFIRVYSVFFLKLRFGLEGF